MGRDYCVLSLSELGFATFSIIIAACKYNPVRNFDAQEAYLPFGSNKRL